MKGRLIKSDSLGQNPKNSRRGMRHERCKLGLPP